MTPDRAILEACTLSDVLYRLDDLLHFHAAEPDRIKALADDAVSKMEGEGWQDDAPLTDDENDYLDYCRQCFYMHKVPLSITEYQKREMEG